MNAARERFPLLDLSGGIGHTCRMEQERRRHPRFCDVGRVDAPEVCMFPGVLQDVSICGCRVEFPMQVDIDMEREYMIRFTPTAEKQLAPFSVRAHPVRLERGESNSVIAFSLMPSSSSHMIETYVDRLARQQAVHTDYAQLLSQPECQFI